MAVLRGKGLGLEIALGERDFEEALAELEGKLGERPGFYSGTQATAAVGRAGLPEDQLERLRTLLSDHGITLEGVTTAHPDDGEELARRRALRPKRELQLSDAARSLTPDFAGARKDIAVRRSRGDASARPATIASGTSRCGPCGPSTMREGMRPERYQLRRADRETDAARSARSTRPRCRQRKT